MKDDADRAQKAKSMWEEMDEKSKEELNQDYKENLEKYKKDMENWKKKYNVAD